jgi:hypothetical protein
MQPRDADASLTWEPVQTRRLTLPSLSSPSVSVWYDYSELNTCLAMKITTTAVVLNALPTMTNDDPFGDLECVKGGLDVF